MDLALADIAIVGFSFKLPQGVEDDDAFWDVLRERKNLMTEWPESRLKADSFLEKNNKNVRCRGGHFINEDVAAFDAPFFSLTAKEAASMDPLQRWTLEAAYRAFEKAGMPLSNLRDSQTAVFSASMTEDWARMTGMDPDNADRTAVTGTVASIIPNRLSFYFGLHGPSVHVDTACSGSLAALDMACKALRDGDASAALVTGSNLILDPAVFQMLSSQNFLSPSSLCYSFDHRADGYARGEGIIAVVLKPVRAALRDGDMIRAVIRATGSNQDGHTPGLTQPSPQAQEDLIRHVHNKAGLPLKQTRYFEAHGTGTPVGDPIEMKAIGRVFRENRSAQEPLYVGSVKANIGHLEGASGLAGVLKSILILEKGIIPPQANFETINPTMDAGFYNLAVPTENTPWPTHGVRRISVNSFGFGGSNTHVILDDALHYLEARGLVGNHCTEALPAQTPHLSEHPVHGTNGHRHGEGLSGTPSTEAVVAEGLPKLLVWSAADEKATKRTAAGYEAFYASNIVSRPGMSSAAQKLDRLAWTLSERRSHLLWRAYAVVDDLKQATLSAAKPIRSSAEVGLAFVFTGQGAQYVDMAWDLVRYPVFAEWLRRIDATYAGLGCQWSIFDELRSSGNIDKPEYSQPLSTAIQIALVELLESFGVVPKAVVGHSSGEIAAAYTIGALSLESACKVSYFRGQLAGKLRTAQAASSPGAMLSINLAEDQVDSYLASTGADTDKLTIACVNSPLNCTLSGSEAAIDALKTQADRDGIFAAKLKTGVAYHSDAMLAIADSYKRLMGAMKGAPGQRNVAVMVSSVTGRVVRSCAALADAQYWVDNMVSRVRFADALRVLAQQSSAPETCVGNITDLVEIGPHAALKRPVQDTMSVGGGKNKSSSSSKIRYSSALCRGSSATQTTLQLMGTLFCLGHAVSIKSINQPGTIGAQGDRVNGNHANGSHTPQPFLVDCPPYPFDHSQRYWAESRISRDFRLREPVSGETLGMRVTDWNPLAPRWRAFLCTETTPWIAHHVVSKTMLYPAAGMLLMAIEAVQQQMAREVAGYLVKEARFVSPIVVRETWEDRVEVQTLLRPARRQQHEKEAAWFDVVVMSYSRDDGGRWTECCTASIQVEYADAARVDGGRDRQLADDAIREQYLRASRTCTLPVDKQAFYQDAAKAGLAWGPWFQTLRDVAWDSTAVAVACTDASGAAGYGTTSLAHPALLDAIFHVLRAAAGQQPVTNVPVRLADAWFAASGWQPQQTGSIRLMGIAKAKKAGTGERGSVYALADNGSVLCAIREAETAAVSTGDDAGGEGSSSTREVNKERTLLHSVEWKPQLSLLDKQDLARLCRADTFTKDEGPIKVARKKLCAVLELATARALAGLDSETIAQMRESLRRHVDWMRHYVGGMSAAQREEAATSSDASLEARFCEVETLLPAWKLYTVVARNLPAILADEVDPLQVIFETDLAAIFYKDLFENSCADGRLASFLDLAAHENPALRILEVGAGTGGVTGHVIRAFQDRETRTGAPSFAEYAYTDISPMFLEGAKKRWPELQGRMTFKTLDLEKDVAKQGSFELGSYDLIVAGSVLHATVDLEGTLRNVRKALRPGGRLVLLEVIDPDDIATNFWTGLVPGWWVAHEDWRPYSAAVPESQWDTSLKATGFSGNDLILRDYQDDACHFLSIIVSTAVADEHTDGCAAAPAAAPTAPKQQPTPDLVVIVDDTCSQQVHLAHELVQALNSSERRPSQQQVRVCAFSQDGLSEVDLAARNTPVICLAEVNKPQLTSLSSDGFRCLQHLVKHASKMLWVTAAATGSQHPHHGAAQGFLRTIRCEQPIGHVVTLTIEGQSNATTNAQHIASVFSDAFDSSSPEVEYVVRQGQILTGRAVKDPEGNDTLRSLLVPRLQHRAWRDAPSALKLDVGAPGTLDSLHFVEDSEHESELGPQEVEIEAKAWGLNFRDVLIALGREEGNGLGADCAGIVTRVGRDCRSSIQPGDRVCMVAEGCMRQFPRAHQGRVRRIPDSLSMESAASVLVPGLTAYYCLVDVANVQKGEWVLVHAAAGSTGQMAVRIAQMLGARVLATTSSPEKRQFLAETFGIPDDHILNSRTTSFARGVMRATGGRGVDCVLNSLSGDGLRASWECMAPFGRFVDIGLADINANSGLPMSMFSKNVSFRAVHLMWLTADVTARLLENTMRLLADGTLQPPQPLHLFRLPDLEKAFRFLQGGKNIGRIVIMPRGDDVVPQFVVERRSYTFDKDASYLIAGGFGGLGRAILKWMASRGAKHFIVPSRSGATSKAAAELVARLSACGVRVFAPKCDVSSRPDLANMLAEREASKMPPIKGCINASMVLQDAIFENMTFSQWDLTMRSKADTAWNLHSLLPRDLDFFVLLSSLAGVIGQSSSANYSAGCAFQDALAHHRVAVCGEKALSIDVGWIGNIGIIAETAAYQRRRQADQDLQTIDDAELLALLTLACDQANPLAQPPHSAPGQVLFGLRTPADFLVRGDKPLPQLERPLLAAFSYVPDIANIPSPAAAAAQSDQPGTLFRQATDADGHMQAVLRALAGKLAAAMSISAEDIEPSKPLSSYGVDSLMAVELRNWISREFSATLAVFDIMGGAPISSVAKLVVQRSTIKSGE
ncbi:putative polyketide synthase [Podospora didyma]|uniref:Polyketide synthase n=1 Tax=Podospora didyma TaxID=330526 RepID=A0AAE0N3V7_9PEZI|nr:putative polyketide synthase [Podospora didyma]